MKKQIGTAISLDLPYWLKWAKKYIQIKTTPIYMPTKITGEHIDFIIIDGCDLNA